MPPMSAHDVIRLVQLLADADRNGLLTRIQVGEARDFAGGDFDVQALLELADEFHLPVRLE